MREPSGAEIERMKALGLPGGDDWWDWDWPEVFKYASGASGGGTPFEVPGNEPAAPFDIASVAKVEGFTVGDNDGPNWTAFGTLHDGRWFYVEAGCDYTGWG